MNTKILYIDNDVASYYLVSELLEGYDIEILHSRCGSLAVQLFNEFPYFDMVITELKLPGIDGFGVLNEIRKTNPNIPVIAQTANVVNNMKYTCLNAGFCEFIPKPIDLGAFVSILNNYFHITRVMELVSL
ncbi:MAG: response regulator [Bacteroidales bacterium]|nr:response regulator [Bacteroidales bacterium]